MAANGRRSGRHPEPYLLDSEGRDANMASLNKVFLMGNLTKDPELRYTPQGVPVTDLRLAVNREWTPQGGGERRKDTLFVDATLWRKQAEVVCQYLKKGSPIFVEGHLAMDSWEAQDGQKKTRVRVVGENFQFIGGRAGGEGSQESGEYGGGSGYRRAAPGAVPQQSQSPSPPPMSDAPPVEEYPPPPEETPF